MSNCKNICRLCDKLIISQSVTVVTVDGTDTLVIDLPQRAYNNCEKYCIIVAQTIPATATILMPVAISIGGVTTTVYPLTKCDCTQVTACGIRTRTRYATKVITGASGGVFRLLGNVNCYPANNLQSLPVAAIPAPATIAVARAVTAKTASTTSKPKTADKVTISANTVTVNKEDK